MWHCFFERFSDVVFSPTGAVGSVLHDDFALAFFTLVAAIPHPCPLKCWKIFNAPSCVFGRCVASRLPAFILGHVVHIVLHFRSHASSSSSHQLVSHTSFAFGLRSTSLLWFLTSFCDSGSIGARCPHVPTVLQDVSAARCQLQFSSPISPPWHQGCVPKNLFQLRLFAAAMFQLWLAVPSCPIPRWHQGCARRPVFSLRSLPRPCSVCPCRFESVLFSLMCLAGFELGISLRSCCCQLVQGDMVLPGTDVLPIVPVCRPCSPLSRPPLSPVSWVKWLGTVSSLSLASPLPFPSRGAVVFSVSQHVCPHVPSSLGIVDCDLCIGTVYLSPFLDDHASRFVVAPFGSEMVRSSFSIGPTLAVCWALALVFLPYFAGCRAVVRRFGQSQKGSTWA